MKVDGAVLDCATQPEEPLTWEKISIYGCPAPLSRLGTALGEEGLETLFNNLGFYRSPDIRLATALPYISDGIAKPGVTAYGQADLLVTPLQMAYAAAGLTNHGLMAPPSFLINAESPAGGWISTLTEEEPVRIFSQSTADIATQALAHKSLPLWETTARTITNAGGALTWYIAGSLPSNTTINQDFTVVVLLEEENANLRILIGRQLLINALVP